MPSLKELLTTPEKRDRVVDDACDVLEKEVADKSGLSGVAIKTAFKVVKGVKPGFTRQGVSDLLDSFLDALNPLYQQALEKGEKPGAYLAAHATQMASALLEITDGKAERAKNAVVKKTYEKLRPTAQKHVEAAAPRIGALLDRHVQI